MNNKARLDKQRRDDRALARIAKDHRARELAELQADHAGQNLMALLDELRAAPLDRWAAIATKHHWLLSQPPEFRTTAVRLLDDLWCDLMDAAGGDPMNEPAPWDEPSAFQRIRWALSALQVAPRPAPTPAKARPKIMLTMTLTGPDDVPVLRSTLAALHGALCGTTSLTPPAGADDDANEPTRRKRRTKAEIEADNAAAAAAAAQPAAPTVQSPAAPASAAPEEEDPLAMLDDGPAPTPAAPANPWDVCFTKTYSRDEVNTALRGWATKAGGAATRNLLNHLGAQNSSSIAPEKFSECMAVIMGKPI